MTDEHDKTGRRHRTPRESPADMYSDETTPPPTDIEELIRRLWPYRKLADHVASLEHRIATVERRPSETSRAIAELRGEAIEMLGHIVDLKGTSGDNGKLGELRRKFEGMENEMKSHGAWIDDLRTFKWKVVGIVTAGSVVGGICVGLITKWMF